MPAIQVSRSIKIDAPVEKVYESVSNFKEWPRWSPWLIAEPGCDVIFALDGDSYSWDGDYVGTGEMTVTKRNEDKSIHYDLLFFRPWKSSAKVKMFFKPDGDGTQVTWKMDSSLPFFMFFMKDMMEGFIGMDYERGLLMLKDLLETGEVPVNLEFGDGEAGPFTVVGLATECAIGDLAATMSGDIKNLQKHVEKGDITPTCTMMSIYHKWDPGKDLVSYTVGFPVNKVSEQLPESYVTVEIPRVETFTSKLTGPYRHMGNAWGAAIMRARNGGFKQSRKVHPFEIYENNPAEVDENELVTTVHFPKR